MTPAARIAAAIEILDRIHAGAPAEKALTGWARASRYAGSGDRAAIRDHVFDVLRQRAACRAMGGGEDGRAEMLGLLRIQGEDPATLFTGERFAPASLSDTELGAGGAPDEHQSLNLPDWLIPFLQDQYGDALPGIAQALSARAPVFLRVNLRKTTAAAVIPQLAELGITARALTDTALIVDEGARRIRNAKPYQSGLVELQDARSQLAVDGLPLRDGIKVLDYCAGGGGKTLAMAGRANAAFFAHDALPERMRDLPERAKRAGVKVKTLARETLRSNSPYDLILCDVPCSGSGTWRRAPAAKWDFSLETLKNLVETQARILDEAAPWVAPGGCLAYATCSILSAENQQAIQGFVARHPDWSCNAEQAWLPDNTGDGFYIAHLTRV